MAFGSTDTKVKIEGLKLRGGDLCPQCQKDTLMIYGPDLTAHCGFVSCRGVFNAKTGEPVAKENRKSVVGL